MEYLFQLHQYILKFKLMGAWGTAKALEDLLDREIKRQRGEE